MPAGKADSSLQGKKNPAQMSGKVVNSLSD